MSENGKQRLRSASNSKLPIASVIPDHDTFERVVKLMKEATKLAVKKSETEERIDEIRDELAAVCQAFELSGFRHGLNGFEYHGYATRKTLSKERLLAAGVSAETIESAYVEGTPFLSCRIVPFDME